MNVNLSVYKNKRICVAVSGGRDSMALLHLLKERADGYGITLSALNCDHGIRGEESARDSAFVASYCRANDIPLRFFKAEKQLDGEKSARLWRLSCYRRVISDGEADLIATAHHMNDNAETVLFNLARGTSLAGMTGIVDSPEMKIIRPLINCTREEIDGYIVENNIAYVTDSSNLTDGYTRNKIRHNVLPALAEAVDGAVENIYRFSRLAAEDEEYFSRQADKITVRRPAYGYVIKPCGERVIFKRAARRVIAVYYSACDFTAEQLERLFLLQSAENGKRFSFLGLTAFKEDGGIAIVGGEDRKTCADGMPFGENLACDQIQKYCGKLACAEYVQCAAETLAYIENAYGQPIKTLKFDLDKIPQNAVIRFRRAGDRFTKFGGGTKSLSDCLTDKKIAQSMRDYIPLVCDENNVLIIGGLEISDGIKVTQDTENVGVFICYDVDKLTKNI